MSLKNSIILPVVLAAAIPMFVVLAGMQIGCKTGGVPMTSGIGIPAAEGTVAVSKGDNNNTSIIIRVKHLAPPSKITPDATVYVVWIQPGEGAIQNIGAMVLNKNLEGVFNTLTPHSKFKVLVTPEPGRKGAQPTHDPVFTSDVERGK